MTKPRFTYFCSILFIVLLGIASRAFSSIPLFVGDFLYAVMMYFIVRFLLPNKKSSSVFFIALLLCFAIELQQTLDFSWLVSIRKTVIGHYALGEGFLWSDLFYYTLGVRMAAVTDVFMINKIKNQFISSSNSNQDSDC
jgi:hypothetical protein